MFQIIITLYHLDKVKNFFNIRDTNFFAAVVYGAKIFLSCSSYRTRTFSTFCKYFPDN